MEKNEGYLLLKMVGNDLISVNRVDRLSFKLFKGFIFLDGVKK